MEECRNQESKKELQATTLDLIRSTKITHASAVALAQKIPIPQFFAANSVGLDHF